VRWYAVLTALLLSLPQGILAAENLNGAARELANKTAAFVGRGEAISLTWRNLSSLDSSELSAARRAFEAALRESGTRPGEAAAPVEAQVTLSENGRQFLLVEEIRRGDERQVWISAWPRPAAAPEAGTALRLERTLLWRQGEQILDAAVAGDTALVLSRSWITWLSRSNGQWTAGPTLTLPGPKNWPRDARGRIRIVGGNFQVNLPGMECRGPVEGTPAIECHPGDSPWVLDSGSRMMLLANLAPGRNYFDGRVALQNGTTKTIAPFFSAAATGDPASPTWVLTMLDGRAQLFNGNFDPLSTLSGWGSDVAGTDAHCGGTSPVLATKPGDAREPDAIQAYAVNERTVAPLSRPLAFSGPVTALWPSGSGAVAVSQDLTTGKYEADLVTVDCAPRP
jgi:hypothetical protein